MQALTIRKRPQALWTARRFSTFLFHVMIVGVATLGIAVGATSAAAQSGLSGPSAAAPPAGWKPQNPPSNEVTVTGTIQQVISDHVAGSPPGVQIQISGPGGSFDANLGTSLPKEILQVLSTGESAEVTGVVRSIDGKSYLMARLLKVASHQISIRNGNGFPAHPPATTGSGSQKAPGAGNGGMQ
jgi:hypothetical protein